MPNKICMINNKYNMHNIEYRKLTILYNNPGIVRKINKNNRGKCCRNKVRDRAV